MKLEDVQKMVGNGYLKVSDKCEYTGIQVVLKNNTVRHTSRRLENADGVLVCEIGGNTPASESGGYPILSGEQVVPMAALLAHRAKHFERVLESLKSEVEGLKDEWCAVCDRPECPESIQIELGQMVASLHNRTIRIIKEASEVEGI